MHYEAIVLFVGCLSVVGCASTTMTVTGPQQPSRGEHCDFRVLTAPPAAGFVEIATIDAPASGIGASTKLDDFKTHIEPYVCQAGGDAAVAWPNGLGIYVKATVLKAKEAAAEGQPPGPSSGQVGGCQFDTQCKGDRVCVKGECADPVRK
jgi:hypothetical protein